jgi:triacylglycerol esterase/lipase EstA (alpha/beta hydrolase family)
MRHRTGRGLIAVVAMALLLWQGHPAHASTFRAEADAAHVAAAKALAAPGLAGANDWTCRLTATRPEPIVLAHGTFAPPALNWVTMAPALKASGFCVFALQYGAASGFPGTAPMRQSAAQLKTFVDGVSAATGASAVDIVGHSQGGMLPRYYIRFLGGATRVDDLVGLAPSNHGTTNLLAPVVGALLCPACVDQVAGIGVPSGAQRRPRG